MVSKIHGRQPEAEALRLINTKFKIDGRQPAEESNISVNEPTFGKKMCWDEGHSKSFSSSMTQRTKYAKNCADDILI